MSIPDNIKGAIFDLDGTLMDSMWFWSELDGIYLRSKGIMTIPEDYLLEIAHLGSYETAVYTKRRFGIPETPEEMMKEWHSMSIDFYTHKVKLKEGALDYLKLLRGRGIKLAVATANDEDLYIPALKLTGIEGFFDAVVNVSEVERKKGFPDIYLLACERMGVRAEESVVFEDILLGIKGAKAGGFKTVGVYDETSERDAEEIEKEADMFIHSFNELL